MSYHRLPFIRKPSQAADDDDDTELVGSLQPNLDPTKPRDFESSSLLHTEPSRGQKIGLPWVNDDQSIWSPSSWRLRHRYGWRFGVIGGCISVTVVLLINLIITVWVAARPTPDEEIDKTSGRLTLFSGNCIKAQHIDTAAHLLINILSTVLLSASNYCMQCLSAPTRAEVNRAHAKKTWADIGVPSVRNLRLISPKNTICWLLLGLFSVPLHLL